MDKIIIDRVIISISENPFFEYHIDCIIKTPKGRFTKGFDATKDFLKEAGIEYFINETIKQYKDATKKSR